MQGPSYLVTAIIVVRGKVAIVITVTLKQFLFYVLILFLEGYTQVSIGKQHVKRCGPYLRSLIIQRKLISAEYANYAF